MKNHKGTTMIELLAILIIISIISLIAVPTVNTLIRNTENRAIEATLINMEEAVRLYRLDRGERNPESFSNTIGFNADSNTLNTDWEIYADNLLGAYISGGWPTPPFGGIYSYRFYTEGENFNHSWNHSTRLRRLDLDNNGEVVIGRSLAQDYFLPSASNPTTGEFLQIRFGLNQSSNGDGIFNLDSNLTNTVAFLRTVEFLLNTSFQDRIYVYHTPTATTLNDAQLVIMIYLDHDRWERRP